MAGHHFATAQVLDINDLDGRQRHILVALVEADVAVLARLGVPIALARRGRRTQQDLGSAELGQDDGGGAGVIAWRRVHLLETLLVLLIDDDEAQSLEGQEEGASGA